MPFASTSSSETTSEVLCLPMPASCSDSEMSDGNHSSPEALHSIQCRAVQYGLPWGICLSLLLGPVGRTQRSTVLLQGDLRPSPRVAMGCGPALFPGRGVVCGHLGGRRGLSHRVPAGRILASALPEALGLRLLVGNMEETRLCHEESVGSRLNQVK